MIALPERVSYRQAAEVLGHPVKCLRGRFIREGLLPWPDSEFTWSREDVLALKVWLDAQRLKDATVPRPHHNTMSH